MTNERHLSIECHAESSGKMRNDIRVTTTSGEGWDLATDEGPLLGGDATAPPPLALFVASLAGCLMTQIRMFARRLKIDVSTVRVDGVAKWVAITNERAPYTSESRGIELRITLHGEHTTNEARELVEAARLGCFVERSVEPATVIEHLLAVDEDWVRL